MSTPELIILLQTAFTPTNIGIVGTAIVGLGGLGITIHINLSNRFDKKEDKEDADKEHTALHNRINDKADSSAFKEVSAKLDIILDKLIK